MATKRRRGLSGAVGSRSRGIFTLQPAMFTKRFGQTQLDPLWLSYGVFEFEPTQTRSSWLYVTSGLSNPWYQSPEGFQQNHESGTGAEFTFATTEAGDWAIETLLSVLAVELLLGAGRLSRKEPLQVNDRIPLHRPLNGEDACILRTLLMTEAEGISKEFYLPSGKVLLAGVTAISDAELEAGRQHGWPHLLDILRVAGFHPVNDPHRQSLTGSRFKTT